MADLDTATFEAIIAPIMTGIKTGNDGMRVQFDIPENQIGEAAKLIGMRGRVLKLTVEVQDVSKNDTAYGGRLK